jgi:hypothetical protein
MSCRDALSTVLSASLRWIGVSKRVIERFGAESSRAERRDLAHPSLGQAEGVLSSTHDRAYVPAGDED